MDPAAASRAAPWRRRAGRALLDGPSAIRYGPCAIRYGPCAIRFGGRLRRLAAALLAAAHPASPERGTCSNSPLAALSLLALGAGPPAVAPQGDPFAPGLRWTLQAPLAEPWIPGSIAFAGRDQLVWAGGHGAGGRLAVVPSPGGAVQSSLFADPSPAGAAGSLAVAGGFGEHALFALLQHPSPDVWQRRTEVTRHDVLAAAHGGAFLPAWAVDLGLVANGPGRLAVDARGERVVAAAFDGPAQAVRVVWLEGHTGALEAQASVPAPSLSALSLSADGGRTALVAGSTLHLFGGPGQPLFGLPLPAGTPALALSADGARLAAGGIGAARILTETAGGYVEQVLAAALPAEAAARVGLSADGTTLGVAWWDTTGAGATRLEVRDAATGEVLVERVRISPPGSLQNAPVAVRLTADGARAAFGTWGDGGPGPEVLLLERAGGAALLEVSLPGSALDLALDASGTRLAVATKNVHANQFGSTGELRLYDTGERDLQVLVQPRPGGVLSLAARVPGASAAIFLLGQPGPALPFPGAVGELLLRRSGRLRVLVRPTDGTGRADLSLPLPASPALIGVELRAQAALSVGGVLHLTAEAVDPLVL